MQLLETVFSYTHISIFIQFCDVFVKCEPLTSSESFSCTLYITYKLTHNAYFHLLCNMDLAEQYKDRHRADGVVVSYLRFRKLFKHYIIRMYFTFQEKIKVASEGHGLLLSAPKKKGFSTIKDLRYLNCGRIFK